MEGSIGNPNGGNRPQDENTTFVSNLEHVLQTFYKSKGDAEGRIAAIGGEVATLTATRDEALAGHINPLLPDLSARSIAQAKVKAAAFFTPTVNEQIKAGTNVKIGFGTWLGLVVTFEDIGAYRENIRQERLQRIQNALRTWLTELRPRPLFMKDVIDAESQIAALGEERRKLSAEIVTIDAQIKGLENQQRIYARPNAPEPPAQLRDAVNRSADGMRDAMGGAPAPTPTSAPASNGRGGNTYNTYHTTTTQGGGGINALDFVILDSILHHHHDERVVVEHRYRDRGDDVRSMGGGWVDDQRRPPSFSDRGIGGGSVPVSAPEPEEDPLQGARMGGGSLRVETDVANNARFFGGETRIEKTEEPETQGARFGGGNVHIGSDRPLPIIADLGGGEDRSASRAGMGSDMRATLAAFPAAGDVDQTPGDSKNSY